MLKPKIKVGNYYELKWSKERKIAFAVLYGFESGKNRDVYSLMIYTDGKNFEFPICKHQFKKWADEGRIKEITSIEILAYAV
ncbi:MAG: hypothetical protein JSW60_08030 [Thermoplasmatales archaeon]|nr:MAG: hypothetical protein JSW60_08030 [Thermoplasmatales archaeon]